MTTRTLGGILFGVLCFGCTHTPEPARLTVFAAASLTDAFTVLADSFEAAHPNVAVELNFAGSQQLAGQLRLGAPADVFASANLEQMQVAVEAGRIVADAPRPFAWNRLVIVTPADNPGQIHALADLARPGLKLVLAAAEVPAGRYAREVFRRAGPEGAFAAQVEANIVSNEPQVRAVLTKIALGEADAGLVYASDAASPDGASTRTISIPDSLNITAVYPIAPIVDSSVPTLAEAFVALVRSPVGAGVLAERGFGTEPVRE